MKRYRMTAESWGEYGVDILPVEDPDGEWVKRDDCLAAVAQLRAELRAALGAERDATVRQGPIECPCRQCQALRSARAAMDELLGAPS